MPTPCLPLAIAAPWRRLRITAMQALAALLLAVIGLQALAPSTYVDHQLRGSAFSAMTADVTLAPRQHEQAAERLAPLPEPLPTLPPVSPVTVLLPLATAPAPDPVAQSPPLLPPRQRPEVPASPREPPHA